MAAISKSNITTRLYESLQKDFKEHEAQRIAEVLKADDAAQKTRHYPLSADIDDRYNRILKHCLNFSQLYDQSEITEIILKDKISLIEFSYKNKDAIEELRKLGKSDPENYGQAITELNSVNKTFATLVRYLSDPFYETYGEKALPLLEFHADVLSGPQKEKFQEIVEKHYIQKGTRIGYDIDAARMNTINSDQLNSILKKEKDNATRQRLYFSITQSFPNAINDFLSLHATSEEIKNGQHVICDASNGKNEKPTIVVDESNKTATLSLKLEVRNPSADWATLSKKEKETGVKIMSELLLEAVYSWETGELLSVRTHTISGAPIFGDFEDGTLGLPKEFFCGIEKKDETEELSQEFISDIEEDDVIEFDWE